MKFASQVMIALRASDGGVQKGKGRYKKIYYKKNKSILFFLSFIQSHAIISKIIGCNLLRRLPTRLIMTVLLP